ncbi:MAG TPA: hypothetical protein VLE95_07875 [Chlamydiales bacterium]|nr:hypothetical protein [Chlamydiales bacterium]
MDDRSFVALLYLKFILSTALFLSAMLGVISPILIFSVFVFMLLVSTRSQYGLDGAYQMNLVVLFGLTIATFSGLHSKISSICLWFICGELVLSYFISGIAKAISPIWRKTYALNAVFSTKTYGHEGMFNIVTKYKHLAFILCWPMFLFELFFPSAFFSEYLCVIFCLIGISFHLFNAVFMGLNTFFFAFLSTYPAFIYCVAKLN